jgi:purine-binding chemotaxis protein CheW
MTELARYDAAPTALAVQTPAVLYVIFRVGDAEYALAADSIFQMESFTGATAVPGAPSFVIGIVHLRGRIVPIVDLRLRFGLVPGPTVLENRIVVGLCRERLVGLLVDSGREVLKISPTQFQAPPKILEEQTGGFIKAVAQVGTRVIMLVDFAKLIGEESLDGV